MKQHIAVIIFIALVDIAITVGVAYIAVHFIKKFW